ncbi:MAG: NfeD family protein [Leptolyngbyaceae cyanobacterium]
MKERAFVRLNTLYTRLRPVQWDGSYIESSKSLEATVVEKIRPHQRGRVNLHGVLWFARMMNAGQPSIPQHSSVKILGRDGNTLLVEPL